MKAATDLVWMREPERRALHATVVATRGPAFVLDRTIFHATSHAYRHPQPADRGDVWIGGDKRVLSRVLWERGEVRHVVRGATPNVGTAVRCHLDTERRDDASAAHAAMHIVLSAFARRRAGALTGEPTVVGGRRFHIAARWNGWSPHALRDLLEEANATLAKPAEVTYDYVPAGASDAMGSPPFEDGFQPTEEVLRVVRIGAASAMACDGTFPPRITPLGRIVATQVSVGRAGVRIQFHVARRR